MPSDDPYRLPRHVLPRRYDLELVVDPERSGFSGRVRIEVEVIEATDRITLNSLDLRSDTEFALGKDYNRRDAFYRFNQTFQDYFDFTSKMETTYPVGVA